MIPSTEHWQYWKIIFCERNQELILMLSITQSLEYYSIILLGSVICWQNHTYEIVFRHLKMKKNLIFASKPHCFKYVLYLCFDFDNLRIGPVEASCSCSIQLNLVWISSSQFWAYPRTANPQPHWATGSRAWSCPKTYGVWGLFKTFWKCSINSYFRLLEKHLLHTE